MKDIYLQEFKNIVLRIFIYLFKITSFPYKIIHSLIVFLLK